MHRDYLLDSLDGFKALVFRLLPSNIVDSIAFVPMTTDGPWTPADKVIFEAAIGIPRERTFWNPGGFEDVPLARDSADRKKWIGAIADIKYRYLFLDPDTGFYTHHPGRSDKTILIDELIPIVHEHEALIVYRHGYWPKDGDRGQRPYPYVRHGLNMLREKGLVTFAYQSQAASLFFMAQQSSHLDPLRGPLKSLFSTVSLDVSAKRLIL